MKHKNKVKKLQRRINQWEKIKDKGAYHKPGSIKK